MMVVVVTAQFTVPAKGRATGDSKQPELIDREGGSERATALEDNRRRGIQQTTARIRHDRPASLDLT